MAIFGGDLPKDKTLQESGRKYGWPQSAQRIRADAVREVAEYDAPRLVPIGIGWTARDASWWRPAQSPASLRRY